VGSGAAFAQGTWAARAAAMPVSILPSRTELFILPNAASPASFRGSREYTLRLFRFGFRVPIRDCAPLTQT